MNTDHYFPNDLKQLRKSAGLRQVDVAQMLGHTSADRISHWEKGLAAPSLVNLFRLSIIYGVAPEEMYRGLYENIVRAFKERSSACKLETTDVDPSVESKRLQDGFQCIQ